MIVYRVRNFSQEFEIADSRKLKRLAWLALPTKQEGDGYTELMGGHDNGCAHFGAWTAILQLAAKSSVRGLLMRDLGGRAVPHDLKSISRITRVPVAVLEEAMPRLVEIGWMEELDSATLIDNPPESPEASGDVGKKTIHTGQDRTGQDRTGQDRTEEDVSPPPLASPILISPPEGIEDKKRKRRFDLLVILKAYNVKLELGKENIFEEWIDATDGHKLGEIERVLKEIRPRIKLPSELIKYLKGNK